MPQSNASLKRFVLRVSTKMPKKWDLVMKESAPPGGFDVHHTPPYMGVKNRATLSTARLYKCIVLQKLIYCLEWLERVNIQAHVRSQIFSA